MKAGVFYEKHKLNIEDIPMPKAKPGEVVIAVKACGICGTDVHIFEGDEGAAKTPRGTVLGHEFAGEIVEVGEGADGYQIGDRVCVDPNKLCGECDFCRSGKGHFCESMIGIGTTVNGGFSEYCAVPSSQVYRIGEHTPFEAAAMCEPVACCLHGIDLCDIQISDTVLVIGGGMIGLIMLQLAKLAGAAKLILAEPVESKRTLGRKLGADICIDPLRESVPEILAQNGIQNVDKVIECVGKPQTMAEAIDYAGNKAIVMLFGLSAPNDTIAVKPFTLFKKELELKASFINPYTQKRALNLIDSGKIDVSSMVYQIAPLDELPQILGDAQLRTKGKFIIKP